MVTILYKSDSVSDPEARSMAEVLQSIISELVDAKDVFVYLNEAVNTVAVDPIEVFVQVNGAKVAEPKKLLEDISTRIIEWKEQNNLTQPINLNVMPVEWHSKFAV